MRLLVRVDSAKLKILYIVAWSVSQVAESLPRPQGQARRYTAHYL